LRVWSGSKWQASRWILELASALVRLEAESAISGPSACKRVRDQLFYRKVADALFTRAYEVAAWRRRAGLVDEPVEESAPEGEYMTLDDLLRECNELLRLVQQDKARLKAQHGQA
jgi:hypothetical protein